MAGLVPAIHVVRRVKRSQASGKSEKLCVFKPLPSAMPVSDPSMARRGAAWMAGTSPAMTAEARGAIGKDPTNR